MFRLVMKLKRVKSALCDWRNNRDISKMVLEARDGAAPESITITSSE